GRLAPSRAYRSRPPWRPSRPAPGRRSPARPRRRSRAASRAELLADAVENADGRARLLDIVEGVHGPRDLLSLLVALAGDQQAVAGLAQRLDAGKNCLRPVADLLGLRRALHDRGADRAGVLRARIVVGDDGGVRQLGDRASH